MALLLDCVEHWRSQAAPARPCGQLIAVVNEAGSLVRDPLLSSAVQHYTPVQWRVKGAARRRTAL